MINYKVILHRVDNRNSKTQDLYVGMHHREENLGFSSHSMKLQNKNDLIKNTAKKQRYLVLWKFALCLQIGNGMQNDMFQVFEDI